jgi:tetratricopeptide (TPR) repeat protein
MHSFRFRAFLSYSHRDTSWGKWLHGALENYSIDKDMVGRTTAAGVVPKTLRPIFRDREDFSAGHSLTDQTNAALEASQFLVAICSPNAARSPYVDEEIRRFKALGRADCIIPIIVDGEPGDPERECFPPALRFKLGPDGRFTDQHEEPIAADARPQGDGKDIARLKVVAGLLGLGLDEIVRRAQRAQRRRMRNWIAALAVLTVIFAGLAAWAEINRRYAQQALDAGIRTANTLALDLAVRLRSRAGIQSGLVKFLLDEALNLQNKLASYGRSTPELERGQARALIEVSLTRLTIGDAAGALDAAEHSRLIIARLLAADSRDPDWQINLAVSYERTGDGKRMLHESNAALAAYQKAREIVQALVDRDGGNAKAQNELAIVHVKIGDVTFSELHQADEALASYRSGRTIRETLVESNRDNVEWKRGLAISYEREGEVLLALGQPEQALADFQKRLALAEEMVGKDAGNTDLLHDLSVAYTKVGDVLLDRANPAGAVEAYEKALKIRKRLAQSDAANLQWQRALFISETATGNALRVLGRFDAALQAYRESVVTAQRMIQARPGDKDWPVALRLSVTQMGIIAYRLVIAHEAALGLEAAEQTVKLAPDLVWLQGNRAHALMFLERTDAARAIYLQYRGTKNVWNQQSWEEFVLQQFSELRGLGLSCPLMDEIEDRFASRG